MGFLLCLRCDQFMSHTKNDFQKGFFVPKKQKLCAFRTKKKWQIVGIFKSIHMYMKVVNDKWCLLLWVLCKFRPVCVCSMPSIFYSLCVDIELKKTSASKLTIYVCINWTQWMLTFRFSRSVVFLFCLAGLCRMLRRNSLEFYKLHLSFFVIVYIFWFL